MLRPVTDHFGLKIRKIFWNFFDHNALLQVFLFPFSHFLNQFGKPKVFCKTYLWLENLIYRNKFTILQSIMKNYKNVLLRKNGHSLEYLNEIHVILIDVQERLSTPNTSWHQNFILKWCFGVTPSFYDKKNYFLCFTM